uniref:Uncharacterized protein n=1 Tax=Helianthus annuus TaxID=4232 RepID=A0A251RN70_HELAN
MTVIIEVKGYLLQSDTNIKDENRTKPIKGNHIIGLYHGQSLPVFAKYIISHNNLVSHFLHTHKRPQLSPILFSVIKLAI